MTGYQRRYHLGHNKIPGGSRHSKIYNMTSRTLSKLAWVMCFRDVDNVCKWMELAVFKMLNEVVPFLRSYHLYSSQLLLSGSFDLDSIPMTSFLHFHSLIQFLYLPYTFLSLSQSRWKSAMAGEPSWQWQTPMVGLLCTMPPDWARRMWSSTSLKMVCNCYIVTGTYGSRPHKTTGIDWGL